MPKTTFEFITLAIVILFVAYLKRDDLKRAFSKESDEFLIDEGIIPLKPLKSYYSQLVDLLIHNSDKNDLKKYIASIEIDENEVNVDDEESYYTDILYKVMESPLEFPSQFIVTLDWKDNASDLQFYLEKCIGDSITEMSLPNVDNYPEDQLISVSSAFTDYQNALEKYNIVMAFLDMGQDTYYMILHKKEDQETVLQLINKVGFIYSLVPG
jgi:hypothetical protein